MSQVDSRIEPARQLAIIYIEIHTSPFLADHSANSQLSLNTEPKVMVSEVYLKKSP